MRAIEIPAGNPGPMTGEGNRTWLLPGRRTALVDAGTGTPSHLDALGAALDAASVTLDAVLVTHAHWDHASGAPAIAARWPRAVFHKLPWPARDGRFNVPWQPLADDQAVEAGDGRLTVVHTPGHAPDHVCFFDSAAGTLFGGDLLIENGTVVIPATRGGDLGDYLRSLERVKTLAPARVLPAHGPDILDPIGLVDRYIEHRARREAQVVEALAGGARTPADVAAAVYERLPDVLRPMAEESALAHLEKLRREGRATAEDGRYSLVRG